VGEQKLRFWGVAQCSGRNAEAALSPACGHSGAADDSADHAFSPLKFRVDFWQHVVRFASGFAEPEESEPISVVEFSTPALLLCLQVLILKFCGCTF
ncbi:MAG: hypothetical protein ACKON9_14110, partial [Planctomycetaceae bacterium]